MFKDSLTLRGIDRFLWYWDKSCTGKFAKVFFNSFSHSILLKTFHQREVFQNSLCFRIYDKFIGLLVKNLGFIKLSQWIEGSCVINALSVNRFKGILEGSLIYSISQFLWDFTPGCD